MKDDVNPSITARSFWWRSISMCHTPENIIWHIPLEVKDLAGIITETTLEDDEKEACESLPIYSRRYYIQWYNFWIQIRKMICQNCHHVVPMSQFCPKCGFKNWKAFIGSTMSTGRYETCLKFSKNQKYTWSCAQMRGYWGSKLDLELYTLIQISVWSKAKQYRNLKWCIVRWTTNVSCATEISEFSETDRRGYRISAVYNQFWSHLRGFVPGVDWSTVWCRVSLLARFFCYLSSSVHGSSLPSFLSSCLLSMVSRRSRKKSSPQTSSHPLQSQLEVAYHPLKLYWSRRTFTFLVSTRR